MTRSPQCVLELVEHRELRVPEVSILPTEGLRLRDGFASQLTIEPPTEWNGRTWLLRSNGYVGYIPVSERLAIRLSPKVPLQTLFGMFEWAYRLDPGWLAGLYDAHALEEFYERLAMILARRTLDRGRRGFHHRYVPRSERLACLRGSINVREHLRRPWAATLLCDFEEHSADIPENQLLCWTLLTIARGGLCSERVAPSVRRAFHALQGTASIVPFQANDCVGRHYDRLCEDYRPLHALCRFFLEHAGAAHTAGNHRMLPFLVDMGRLFEEFVAAWLVKNLPDQLDLRVQEHRRLGERDDLAFRIDLVVREAASGRPMMVLDTKYKATESPAMVDVQQVVTYAESVGCNDAVLVYPVSLARPFDERVGAIRVRSLAFDLRRPIEQAGAELLHAAIART